MTKKGFEASDLLKGHGAAKEEQAQHEVIHATPEKNFVPEGYNPAIAKLVSDLLTEQGISFEPKAPWLWPVSVLPRKAAQSKNGAGCYSLNPDARNIDWSQRFIAGWNSETPTLGKGRKVIEVWRGVIKGHGTGLAIPGLEQLAWWRDNGFQSFGRLDEGRYVLGGSLISDGKEWYLPVVEVQEQGHRIGLIGLAERWDAENHFINTAKVKS